MQQVLFAQSGFWRRAIAFVIDFVSIAILWALASGQAAFQFSINWNLNGSEFVSSVTSINPGHLFNFLGWLTAYFIIAEVLWGATLGKWITRQKVVNGTSHKPYIWQIVVRNLFKFVDMIVGPIVFLLSRKNQSLGDHVAQTYVIANKRADHMIGIQKLTTVRVVFGVLCILNVILIFITMIRAIHVNATVKEMVTKSQSYVLGKNSKEFYNLFVEEYKKETPLKDFQKKVKLSTFDLAKGRGASDPTFYVWSFTTDKIFASGKNEYYQVDVHMRKEGEEWKLVSLKLYAADRK